MKEEEPPRRFSDEMLYRLDERIKQHLEWSEKQTQEIVDRLKTLEDWKRDIEKPVHYAGLVVIGLVLAFVGAVGKYLWVLMTKIHFGP